MPVLEAINRIRGYLPRPLLEHAAVRLDIPLAQVLTVASFYDKMGLMRPEDTLYRCATARAAIRSTRTG